MCSQTNILSQYLANPNKSRIFAPTEPATLPEDQRTRAGRFFLYRAMKYNKQPISINDQITILKGRGLWNSHFSLVPRTNERMRGRWITNNHFHSDKIYPSLCCIAYWLNSINPQNTFVQEFKSLLTKYPSVQPAMMGFTRGWESEPLWQ